MRITLQMEIKWLISKSKSTKYGKSWNVWAKKIEVNFPRCWEVWDALLLATDSVAIFLCVLVYNSFFLMWKISSLLVVSVGDFAVLKVELFCRISKS